MKLFVLLLVICVVVAHRNIGKYSRGNSRRYAFQEVETPKLQWLQYKQYFLCNFNNLVEKVQILSIYTLQLMVLIQIQVHIIYFISV